MWAKIEVIPSEFEIIYLPKRFIKDNYTDVIIKFGEKSVKTCVQYIDDHRLEESTYETPRQIKISDKLRDRLLIPESLVYQVKISDSFIVIGPVIGLLLGTHTEHYNPRHMQKYSDRFGIYSEIGGLIYAFSPKSVNWKKRSVYGLYYNISTNTWEYGNFPLPEVIYRRDFHSNPKYIEKLNLFTKGRLFNSYRFSKYELFEYINLNTKLRKFLPPTKLSLKFMQVKSFIDCHSKVILKPIDLSRGRGICIIEKFDTSYKVTDYRDRSPEVTMFYDDKSFEKFFIKNNNFFNRYLIQKYLPLARIGKSFFDIRVVMQKGRNKEWGCTGIECRVSNDNSHLTNISRGGYALFLDEALRYAFTEDHELLAQKVKDFSYDFCRYMDEFGEHFAEFGMDIAIDIDKNLWLIEANVFPSFKGFKKMDWQTYLSIRYTPLLYALNLTEFGKESNTSQFSLSDTKCPQHEVRRTEYQQGAQFP